MSDPPEKSQAIPWDNAQSAEELLPMVYDELRRLAARRMRNEPSGHTLQPTALVHEAWLRLLGDRSGSFDSRAHFFGAAAEAMRRILVESARSRMRLKRGGNLQRVDLDEVDLALEMRMMSWWPWTKRWRSWNQLTLNRQ